MEVEAHREEREYSPVHAHDPAGRQGGTREELKERGLTRTVGPDNSHGLAPPDGEVDVEQRLESRLRVSTAPSHQPAHRSRKAVELPQAIVFAQLHRGHCDGTKAV